MTELKMPPEKPGRFNQNAAFFSIRACAVRLKMKFYYDLMAELRTIAT